MNRGCTANKTGFVLEATVEGTLRGQRHPLSLSKPHKIAN